MMVKVGAEVIAYAAVAIACLGFLVGMLVGWWW